MQPRELAWDGCLNVRDLGGLPTEDSEVTRFGAVIRADSVRQLSETGWQALVSHGVGRIVDLRWDEELAEDEPREQPLEVVHVPVFPEPPHPVWHTFSHGDRTSEYLGLLEWGAARFARAVAAIAHAPEGPVVGAATIAADYELSNPNLEPLRQPWIDGAPDEAERARRVHLWMLPDMKRVLGELERRYGSTARYLAGGGVSRDDVARVRARLRA